MSGSRSNAVDDYIASFPDPVRELLSELRETIHSAAPAAEEMIVYGIPTFAQEGNLVHFGGFKKHVGFYPTPSGIETFRMELNPYKVSKGAVQFRLDEPLPLDLVRRIVEFRVSENTGASRRGSGRS